MAASTLQVEPAPALPNGDHAEFVDVSERELYVHSALPSQRADALSLLYAARTSRTRELVFRWAGGLKRRFPHLFLDLFVAERAGEMAGAVWGMPASGRQVTVVPPVVVADEPGSTKRELVAALDASLARDETVQLASASLGCGSYDAPAMLANGFNYVTDIARLACVVGDAKVVGGESSLEFEPFQQSDIERLKSILLRASADSLDCPRLRGLRSIDDIYLAHVNRNGLVPSHWHIVRHDQQDVGCLLVSCHKNKTDCDVVYLGLVADARGKGWGHTLIHRAIHIAQSTGATRLFLDCDVHNPPAVKTYLAAGFREVERRSIFVKAYTWPTCQREQPGARSTDLAESAE